MKRLTLHTLLVLSALSFALTASAQTEIRAGRSQFGTVLYNWDGQYLRKGRSEFGEPILNVTGTLPIAVLICLLN